LFVILSVPAVGWQCGAAGETDCRTGRHSSTIHRQVVSLQMFSRQLFKMQTCFTGTTAWTHQMWIRLAVKFWFWFVARVRDGVPVILGIPMPSLNFDPHRSLGCTGGGRIRAFRFQQIQIKWRLIHRLEFDCHFPLHWSTNLL
jgi:hypothetical protein